DLAEGLAGLDRATDLGDVDEHDVTERVLRVVGDAEAEPTVLDADPLVIGRVPEVVGHVHPRNATWAVRSGRPVREHPVEVESGAQAARDARPSRRAASATGT